MKTFHVTGYQTRQVELEGWPIRVASYQLGERFACKVDNVDPGAVIARGEGATRDEAEEDALGRAAKHLRQTRRIEQLAAKVQELAEVLADLDAER